ncbi:MAG: pyridoxal-phosphate dependent enzyme [Acidobacteria bacterium]|nr:pyridoxal-phosphate dependent enzyme [Acidobacteriota bacterium]
MSVVPNADRASLAGPSLEAIREAHARIAPHIHRTPVMTSQSLDAVASAQLYFKCENLQKTGSFKIRGATNTIFSLGEEEVSRGVVTHSSGNHAAAVALAARWRGVRAWIVMPSNSSLAKRRAVEAYGGEISYCEPTLSAREATAVEIMRRTGAVIIHPYDDDRIIAGQATAAVEFLEEVPGLDFLLAPVSGGGLLSGTAIAAQGLEPGIHVVGCEPKNADDAYRSLAAGRLVPANHPDTIADGLRAQLGERTFAILRERVDRIVVLTEEEIVAAMRLVWERMKLVIEPSSAVAVAPALGRKLAGPERAAEGKRIGIILSGGNVDLVSLPFR